MLEFLVLSLQLLVDMIKKNCHKGLAKVSPAKMLNSNELKVWGGGIFDGP